MEIHKKLQKQYRETLVPTICFPQHSVLCYRQASSEPDTDVAPGLWATGEPGLQATYEGFKGFTVTGVVEAPGHFVSSTHSCDPHHNGHTDCLPCNSLPLHYSHPNSWQWAHFWFILKQHLMVVHINQLYHVQPLNQNPQDLTLLPIFYFSWHLLFPDTGKMGSDAKCLWSAFTEFMSFNPNSPIRGWVVSHHLIGAT